MLTEEVMNSPTTQTIAKRLWPTMLFIVVMSIISSSGLYIFKGVLNQTSITFAFLSWYAAMLGITVFGAYLLLLDARVKFHTPQT